MCSVFSSSGIMVDLKRRCGSKECYKVTKMNGSVKKMPFKMPAQVPGLYNVIVNIEYRSTEADGRHLHGM